MAACTLLRHSLGPESPSSRTADHSAQSLPALPLWSCAAGRTRAMGVLSMHMGGHSQRLGLSPTCCLSEGHPNPHRRHPGLSHLCVLLLSSLSGQGCPLSSVKALCEVSRAGAVTGPRSRVVPGSRQSLQQPSPPL